MIETMTDKALRLVRQYVLNHVDKTVVLLDFTVYIVWQCKTLQNWKFLISTDIPDGMYYELTFNGDRNEWYLDAYKKFENQCIPND